MPKFTPKAIQDQLAGKQIWPFYWLYGTEKLKATELIRRIQNSLADALQVPIENYSLDHLDGEEITSNELLDQIQSASLLQRSRLIVVRNAHAIKQLDNIAPLLRGPVSVSECDTVVVFVSRDLDQRKKISKQLTEKAAVISCEEVPDRDRDAWIEYLAQRKNIKLSPNISLILRSLEPWSLDLIERELEKFELGSHSDSELAASVLTGQGSGDSSTQKFVDSFFTKDLRASLESAEQIADRPNDAIPLIGLLAWNVRQMLQLIGGSRSQLSPYLARKLDGWIQNWSLSELQELTHRLSDLDYSLKQTPRPPRALWTQLCVESLPASADLAFQNR